LTDVFDRDPGEEAGGVGAAQLVLEERRDVDQAGRMPEGEVFQVRAGQVGADRVVAGPVLPAHARAELRRPRVKGAFDGHPEPRFWSSLTFGPVSIAAVLTEVSPAVPLKNT